MNDADIKKNAKAALAKAARLLEGGDPDRAREVLEGARDALGVSSSRKALKYRARLNFAIAELDDRSGNVESAVQHYQRATELDPELSKASARIVELRIDSGDALRHDMVPHYIDYIAQGASERIKYGALRRLQRILRIRLTDRRAEIVWRMEMLRRLRKARPEINFPKLYLGRGHYVRDEFREAIGHLEALSGAAAETNNVLNMLGRCHEKLGDLTSARAAYEKSLREDAGQAGVHFRLGRIELKLAEC